MTKPEIPADPLAVAVTSITWLILVNKPVYPLYVWYFVGDGVQASLLTMAVIPFYLAVLLLARTSSLAARVAFPLVGLADTIFETKLFGAGSATELFAMPCALIAALAFRPDEARWLKGVLIVMYTTFLLAHGHLGEPIHAWTDEGLARLREINIFAVASLTVFVGWRFSRLKRDTSGG